MSNEKGFSLLIIIITVAVVAVLGGGAYLVVWEKPPEIVLEKPGTEKSSAEIIKQELKEMPEVTVAPKVANVPKSVATPQSQTGQARDPWRDPLPPAPTNLSLPIVIKDIKESDELISPYGIIRHSRDGGIGHGGIDFPLESSSTIYAVEKGTIIKNNLEDMGGGNTVDILILPSEFPGEGWIFKYEHITLEQGLAVGGVVQKGQKIGVNALVGRGNNHIGLEYHFKDFTIARNKICWVDRLETTARQQLESEFNQIKKTSAFIQSWQTANEEGYYQYKGFLDEKKYPNGPQLCYPLGTDGRISIN